MWSECELVEECASYVSYIANFLKEIAVVVVDSWSMFQPLFLCSEWEIEAWVEVVLWGDFFAASGVFGDCVLLFYSSFSCCRFWFRTMVLLWCSCWENWELNVKYSKMRFTWRKWRHRGFKVYSDLADSVEGIDLSIQ